ncbi:MAG: phage antirepressor KilAC domain-containing protein [Pontiellaceae bacterium]|nr:phage antirepressor KilAC domain-containing protein [Pontiellaceae bacterium]MBN2786492.1 phage antirepressor KilAC domain-containing protein [Pontiellaceae bacterium]
MSQLELVKMEGDTGEFYFDNLPIRVVMIEGEPWFVAKDVCDALEIGNVSQALSYLDEDERTVITNEGLSNSRNGMVALISESGLYSLILRSRKETAKRFKRWITHEVIPVIRKTGGYGNIIPNHVEALRLAADNLERAEREKTLRLEAEKKIELDAPKVAYATGMAVAYNSCLVAELAKKVEKAVNSMCDPKYHLGEKTLYKWLRKHGYVMRRTNEKNLPTQRSLNLGIMEIEHRTVSTPKGIREIRTTRITAKGQEYFVDKFLKAGGTPE